MAKIIPEELEKELLRLSQKSWDGDLQSGMEIDELVRPLKGQFVNLLENAPTIYLVVRELINVMGETDDLAVWLNALYDKGQFVDEITMNLTIEQCRTEGAFIQETLKNKCCGLCHKRYILATVALRRRYEELISQ